MNFALGKIPIRTEPFFWLLVFLISAINSDFNLPTGLMWAFVIIVSVVVHELGHALTGKAFGQRVSIELVGFGGLTKRYGPPLKLWKEFIVVASGPIAGFLLAGLSWMLLQFFKIQSASYLEIVLLISVSVNIFWTLVNLLPVQPLDGGHLLRIIFEGMMGLKGVKIASFISMLVAALITFAFLAYGAFLIGAFFLMFTFESYKSFKECLSLTDQDRNVELQHLLKVAERDYQRGHLDYALEKLNIVRNEAKAGVLYLTATQLKAEILDEKGAYKEAYELLLPLKSKLNAHYLQLLHQLAYRIGDWNQAIELGNLAYRNQPSYETALINALSYGIIGQARPAVGWLKRSLEDGLPNIKEVLAKVEFNAIRSDPQFQSIIEHS